MSQRTFSQDNLGVFCGWDRPLARFFLLIEKQDASDDDENEGYVFNNLARPNPAMTLAEIELELFNAKIIPPPTLFADLEEDKKLNRGNFQQAYFKLGDEWKKTVGRE